MLDLVFSELFLFSPSLLLFILPLLEVSHTLLFSPLVLPLNQLFTDIFTKPNSEINLKLFFVALAQIFGAFRKSVITAFFDLFVFMFVLGDSTEELPTHFFNTTFFLLLCLTVIRFAATLFFAQ